MNPQHQLVIRRALEGAEGLPPAERADLYEGIAALLNPVSPAQAQEAAVIGHALREAEAMQLHFKLEFSPAA
jgi:hypothetical protein